MHLKTVWIENRAANNHLSSMKPPTGPVSRAWFGNTVPNFQDQQMFDINFFQNAKHIKKGILNGQIGVDQVNSLFEDFEKLRNKEPYVFNIETTNYCNMRCVMCPRTSLMTRKNVWIDDGEYESVLDQITPHDTDSLDTFWKAIENDYGITADTKTEDGFYFNVVAKCLTLHGYGEPLLDKFIVDRVQKCTDRGIPTYFSCVPANINMARIEELMDAGLSVIKFSIDALDDEQAKAIRGNRNNFDHAFQQLLEVTKLRDSKKYDTKIVVTLIALGATNDDLQLQRDFMKLFNEYNVFNYVKSQDNRWYFEDDEPRENLSHYVREYCEFPWTSATVMANGEVVPCTQDYDAEMSFGNVRDKSLKEIWNGEKYQEFRRWHLTGEFPEGNKCNERCDLPKIYHRLGKSCKPR
jgi:radical SAM protein with 4Fe4S-binding SPASM domain